MARAGKAPAGVPPSRRVDPRRARTRTALISAAQQLIAAGRAEVSIQEITGVAGVGFGSFYNHFDDKPQLWAAAVSETLRAHGEVIEALTRDFDDPAEIFCVGLRLTGRLQRSFPQLARVLLHAGVAAVLADEGGLIAQARRDLEAAIAAGRLAVDVDLGMHITIGSMLGLIALLDAQPGLDAGAVADDHAIRILRAFGLGGGEARDLAARPLPDITAALD